MLTAVLLTLRCVIIPKDDLEDVNEGISMGLLLTQTQGTYRRGRYLSLGFAYRLARKSHIEIILQGSWLDQWPSEYQPILTFQFLSGDFRRLDPVNANCLLQSMTIRWVATFKYALQSPKGNSEWFDTSIRPVNYPSEMNQDGRGCSCLRDLCVSKPSALGEEYRVGIGRYPQ